MTKLFAGMIAVLVLSLSLTGWLFYRQIGLTAQAEEGAKTWQEAALRSEAEVTAAKAREGALNASVRALASKKLASDLLAAERESEINNLKKSESDTNETISCLDQRVPAELDRLLNTN